VGADLEAQAKSSTRKSTATAAQLRGDDCPETWRANVGALLSAVEFRRKLSRTPNLLDHHVAFVLCDDLFDF
jgi:hypothetical protein